MKTNENKYDPDLEHERKRLEDAENNGAFHPCLNCGGDTGDYQMRFCSQECETRYYDEHAVYVEENGLDKKHETLAEITASCDRIHADIMKLIAEMNHNLEGANRNLEACVDALGLPK